MARIPDDDLERLKKEVSLERLVTGFGIELRRQGAELVGRCPFHEDNTPSLIVSPKTNLWHCMGACNVGGSVVDWVMKTRGVSFRYAVELLRGEHPSLFTQGRVLTQNTATKLEAPIAAEAEDREVLRQVVNYYH